MNAFKLSLLFALTISYLQSTAQVSKPENEDNEIYSVVEAPPSFPGGLDSLKTYLKRNITYPEIYNRYRYTERLLVRFVVEKDGSISNIVLLNEGFLEFAKIARKLFLEMPAWIPARQGDRLLRCYRTIPVRFCPDNCSGW